jgi:hypothetical protein
MGAEVNIVLALSLTLCSLSVCFITISYIFWVYYFNYNETIVLHISYHFFYFLFKESLWEF